MLAWLPECRAIATVPPKVPGSPRVPSVAAPTPLNQRTFLPGAGSRRSHSRCRSASLCAPSPGRRVSATAFIGHRPLSGGRRGASRGGLPPVPPHLAPSALPSAATRSCGGFRGGVAAPLPTSIPMSRTLANFPGTSSNTSAGVVRSRSPS